MKTILIKITTMLTSILVAYSVSFTVTSAIKFPETKITTQIQEKQEEQVKEELVEKEIEKSEEKETTQALPQTSLPAPNLDANTMKVFNEVNKVRAEAGLAPLALDTTLCSIAAVRSEEIVWHWSHTRPNGSTFGNLMKDNNYQFSYAKENLGRVWEVENVIEMWKESKGHYESIMGDFNRTGVAVCSKYGLYFIVQIYAR